MHEYGFNVEPAMLDGVIMDPYRQWPHEVPCTYRARAGYLLFHIPVSVLCLCLRCVCIMFVII
jgi:hypothetical protein